MKFRVGDKVLVNYKATEDVGYGGPVDKVVTIERLGMSVGDRTTVYFHETGQVCQIKHIKRAKLTKLEKILS